MDSSVKQNLPEVSEGPFLLSYSLPVCIQLWYQCDPLTRLQRVPHNHTKKSSEEVTASTFIFTARV